MNGQTPLLLSALRRCLTFSSCVNLASIPTVDICMPNGNADHLARRSRDLVHWRVMLDHYAIRQQSCASLRLLYYEIQPVTLEMAHLPSFILKNT